ncbi:connector enhancer of kinase suppressor of ras 1 isoform X1 [Neomonachus schauinslandi]|uniref:Connector enhancer of kinase suppressor of ras 1 isoform X1 n=1 Tax=Neomonachus schauinslandi TaxID=29088 RepID=A0A8M1M7K6_NEOSC|nr:connector enhancer of kinase suppressor of ras 1 isoform X1 [Neomonachus schauinslandi]
MEPVTSWTPGKVAAWLRGLDDSLQDYCFEDWELSGKYLLQLCPRSLEALTVWPLGHQELILEGVEQLRALSSGLQTENLQSLTEGLLEGTYAFQNLVQGHLEGCAEPPADVLSAAVELAHEARTLLFWLNRYLFSHLNDFSACQKIGELCGELGQALQEDSPVAEKESRVLGICSHVARICHHILSCSPQELLEQRAVLERVQLDHPLGLEVHTTSNCLHFVSRVGTQVPADSRLQILPGDEIVQVNEQVVVSGEERDTGWGRGEVGWPHKNVVRELLREPAGVSLVLKKVPVPKTPPQTPPPVPGSPQLTSPSLAFTALSPRASSEEVFAFDLTSNPSPAPSPTWTDSTSLDLESRPILPAPPATLPAGVAEAQEAPEQPDKSPVSGRNKSKGVATRLSRRRVSCRELGQPDCDGWLLLRKAPGGFMGPRWRRCWFVLKRHTLYWYCQPRDEKAEGLINVSNYSLESGQDQKKKYVFQLTHDVYKPFIFAADTLEDLSMWVRHLITCISKYQSPGRASLPREEDCYSETEAEDPDDEAGSRSASPSPAQVWSPLHGDTSPAATPTQGSPRTSFGPPTDNSEGALEGMVRGLRQGGVSLLGQPQPLTHEQWRSSFMRRNRDPQLNERAHRVRALQSTLKAKLQELQALEEVLGDPELTGEKFRQWKERNQELYSEGLGGWGVVQAEGHSQVLSSDSREQSSHPLPPDPEEQSCLCPLTPESNLRPPDL